MSIEAAFDPFPILTTPRLHLRQLLPTDGAALFVIKSDFEVTKHYGQEPHQSVSDSLAWIDALRTSYARRTDIAWAVTLKDGTFIGACTLWNLDAGYHHGEIGYELHPTYEKRGFMTEAMSAILDYGFNTLGLHRIEATPFDDNGASKSLLLKLGFTYEGNLRQRYFFRDHYKDQLYYGLLKAEWLNR
ncbi:MAG: GNAT family N-acetyltransferase [Burkholderiales bacterium]|nr:GNAT family N-acetyltransferase [Anaerolineae bacterium]